jgi:hypothetical protein
VTTDPDDKLTPQEAQQRGYTRLIRGLRARRHNRVADRWEQIVATNHLAPAVLDAFLEGST